MSYMHSKKNRVKHPRAMSKSPAAASRKSPSNAKRVDSSITKSTGNVFLDLGFSPPEARNLLIRADLMIRIAALIQRRNLSQSQAAKLFHVSQPRISDLTRGKIELFSIDNLIAMLDRVGIVVEVRFKSQAA